jgi:hypothetical protein
MFLRDRCDSPLVLPARGTLYAGGATFRVKVLEFDGMGATLSSPASAGLGSDVTLWVDGPCPGVELPAVVVGSSADTLRLALRPGLGGGPADRPCSCRLRDAD